MSEEKTNKMVVKMGQSWSNYDVPEATEGNGRNARNVDWVAWGEENDYFDRLIKLDEGSATNSRCISGIADMIFGEGIRAVDVDEQGKEQEALDELFPPEEWLKIAHDLKKLGQGTVAVEYSSDKKRVVATRHFPTEKIRSGKANSLGVVKTYYYSPNWSEVSPTRKPKAIPAFGHGGKKDRTEILVLRKYASGHFYYTPVDYHAALTYCQLEKEVGQFHVANIQNGLNPMLLLNFNNGIPDGGDMQEIEENIIKKFGGSKNAGVPLMQWNEDKANAATIESVVVPDIHEQYEFLANEGREKIMLGHGITSPILLGIKDNTGFGNNAEELRTASVLMDNILIKPFQEVLLRGVRNVMKINKLKLDVYFKTLQPIEFTELDNIETSVVREKETGEQGGGTQAPSEKDEQE